MNPFARCTVAFAVLGTTVVSCGPRSSTETGHDGRWPCPEGLEGTAITFSISVVDAEREAIERLLRRFQSRCRGRLNLAQLVRSRRPLGPTVTLRTDLDATELLHQVARDKWTNTPSVHLFAQDNVALYGLVNEDLVQPLEGDLETPKSDIHSNVPSEVRRHFAPFRPNVRLTYANTAELEKAGVGNPPTTTEGLVRAAEALKRTFGKARVTMSLATGDPAAVTVSELILSFGGDPLKLNDAGSVTAFAFLQDLWKNGLLARETFNARYDTELDNLRTGVAALAQNWSFTSAALGSDRNKFKVYSGWEGPAGVCHVVGGDVLGMPRGVSGKERKAAAALAQFLTSREAQKELARANRWPSIYKSVSPAGPEERAIEDALANPWIRPSTEQWQQVSDAMNDAMERIVFQVHPDIYGVLDELNVDVQRDAPGRSLHRGLWHRLTGQRSLCRGTGPPASSGRAPAIAPPSFGARADRLGGGYLPLHSCSWPVLARRCRRR